MESIESLKNLMIELGEVSYTLEKLKLQLMFYHKMRKKLLEKIDEHSNNMDKISGSQERATQQETE